MTWRWIGWMLIALAWAWPAGSACAEAEVREPLPITPRAKPASTKSTERGVTTDRRAKTGASGWMTTGAAMAAVLGLVFLAAKLVRKNSPQVARTLPAEVLQVLGRKMLDYRSTIHLVRCGSRLLIVGVSQGNMTTLGEITDPVEVDYLAGLCRPSPTTTVGETFNQLFRRFQNDGDPPAEPIADVDPAVVPIDGRYADSGISAERFHPTAARQEAV